MSEAASDREPVELHIVSDSTGETAARLVLALEAQFPDQAFVEVSYGLAPGDTFLMYTDGVTEAMSPENELYGRERLVHLLRSGSRPIRDLVEQIVADVARFVGDRPQRDDICLVGFRRLPE